MKYLESAPFRSPPTSKEYRDNWEATFGKKKKCKKTKKLKADPGVDEFLHTADEQVEALPEYKRGNLERAGRRSNDTEREESQ